MGNLKIPVAIVVAVLTATSGLVSVVYNKIDEKIEQVREGTMLVIDELASDDKDFDALERRVDALEILAARLEASGEGKLLLQNRPVIQFDNDKPVGEIEFND